MIRTALTTLAIAAVLGLGTTLDDHSADYAQLDSLEDAQQQVRHQAIYERAVQDMCGPNAGWMELQAGVIQCTTKRGTPTRRVALTTTEAKP